MHLVQSTKYTSTSGSTSACTSSTCASASASTAHMATGVVGGKCILLLIPLVLVLMTSAIAPGTSISISTCANNDTSSYLYNW